MGLGSFEDGDDDDKGRGGPTLRHKEFDCPGCNANNPVEPPFGDGDDLLCNYCGMEFRAKVSDEGKVRFQEM